jgi:hypothetical protein
MLIGGSPVRGRVTSNTFADVHLLPFTVCTAMKVQSCGSTGDFWLVGFRGGMADRKVCLPLTTSLVASAKIVDCRRKNGPITG